MREWRGGVDSEALGWFGGELYRATSEVVRRKNFRMRPWWLRVSLVSFSRSGWTVPASVPTRLFAARGRAC
jgi:hypothetical protein